MVDENSTKADGAAVGFLPIAVWLGAQLAALALAAFRVRLWSTAPKASEQLALTILLVTQTSVASLIFPLLLDSARSTLIALVTLWPMAELAAFLADVPLQKVLPPEFCICLWLLTFHLWTRALRSDVDKLLASAIAGMLALGGPILWYLRVDFAGTGMDWRTAAWLGPTLGVLSQLLANSFIPAAWIAPGVMCVAALFMNANKKLFFRRR